MGASVCILYLSVSVYLYWWEHLGKYHCYVDTFSFIGILEFWNYNQDWIKVKKRLSLYTCSS